MIHLLTKLSSIKSSRPSCVAIGIFDGVHKGHWNILDSACKFAQKRHLKFRVLTFDPHPDQVLKKQSALKLSLTSLAHRALLLRNRGCQEIVVARFDRQFASQQPDDFIRNILIKKLNAKAVFVGSDFCFGYQAKGNVGLLKEHSKKEGFNVYSRSLRKQNGVAISSSRIRVLIERGDLKNASRLLGRAVGVYGTVVKGSGRGRKLGFPTANIDPHHECLPPAGVYAAYGLFEGRRVSGVVHIGDRPTFNDKKSLEVHFVDFHRNIYGRDLELMFIAKLRDIRRFSSSAHLTEQIKKDIILSKNYID